MARGRPKPVFERLFPSQHIQYFTCRSLTGLVKKSGLEVVWLNTRKLPFADITASLVVRTGIAVMQWADGLTGSGILICAVLRRPWIDQDSIPS
jgi:hypothetical protein